MGLFVRAIMAWNAARLAQLKPIAGLAQGQSGLLATVFRVLTGVAVAAWIVENLAGVFADDTESIASIAAVIQDGIQDGSIFDPGPRRDGMNPDVLVITGISSQAPRAFLTYQYFSRKFVNAVRSRERTASFRGRGGRRQARTKR